MILDEEYLRMPPVFQMDTFDDCLEITPKTLYCSVAFHLQPENADDPSDVWTIIEVSQFIWKKTFLILIIPEN